MNGIDGVGLHEFVKDLKNAKAFTAKQCLVIENLYIYFRDLKVYKVIIAVNPLMLKKARKLGLNSQYSTIYFDDIPIRLPFGSAAKGLVPDLTNSSPSGRGTLCSAAYIALYNPNDGTCSVFNGEETEEEQINKLAAKKNIKNKS